MYPILVKNNIPSEDYYISIFFENSLIIKNLIALSYLIEAYAFSNEYFLFNTTYYYKTLFIIILSLILFILIINKKTKNY
jgi:hypothetical protein